MDDRPRHRCGGQLHRCSLLLYVRRRHARRKGRHRKCSRFQQEARLRRPPEAEAVSSSWSLRCLMRLYMRLYMRHGLCVLSCACVRARACECPFWGCTTRRLGMAGGARCDGIGGGSGRVSVRACEHEADAFACTARDTGDATLHGIYTHPHAEPRLLL